MENRTPHEGDEQNPQRQNYVSPFTTHYTQVQTVEDSPVRVRYKTKNGTPSPYISHHCGPDTEEFQPLETNSPVRSNNPYNSYSGRSTPVLSTPTSSKEVIKFPETYEKSSALDPSFQLKEDVAHRNLVGRCRYIEFPAVLPPYKDSDKNNHQAALFIGQVRFETTPAQLSWLVQRCCGAVATSFESRGNGCYILFCRSDNDRQLVRSLHKRVLFDVNGVWLARTPEEIDALCEYVALDAALVSKKQRLPRDSLVVEELKDGVSPSRKPKMDPNTHLQFDSNRSSDPTYATGGMRPPPNYGDLYPENTSYRSKQHYY